MAVIYYLQGANGENREVNRLTEGQYFGELGLISKKPRAASVFAEGTTKCAGELSVFIYTFRSPRILSST